MGIHQINILAKNSFFSKIEAPFGIMVAKKTDLKAKNGFLTLIRSKLKHFDLETGVEP